MLKKNKILKVINIIPELLKIINIFALLILFSTKYYVYNVKENINSIEKQTIITKNKQNDLILEINYLTNPTRLKNIYDKLEQDKKLNMQYTTIEQEINLKKFKKFLKEKGSK